jgi:hypothetical protein
MAMVTLSDYERRRIRFLLPPGGNQRIWTGGIHWQARCPA